MTMKVGYARVSTTDQNTDLQIDAIRAAGAERIYVDKMSGKNTDRPEFQTAMDVLREGDTLVFYKLDRIGRNLNDLLSIMEELQQRGVHIHCIKENIDTTTASGKMMFHLMAVFADYERELISERTKAGLEAARARGRKGGRPPVPARKLEQAIRLHDAKTHTVKEIFEMTGVNRGTLYRALKNRKEQTEQE